MQAHQKPDAENWRLDWITGEYNCNLSVYVIHVCYWHVCVYDIHTAHIPLGQRTYIKLHAVSNNFHAVEKF